MKTARHICIATGTRADWGLLTPLARALAERDDCTVDIIATNMHLDARFGMTVNDIIADGFTPAARVAMPAADDSETARVASMATCMTGFADALTRLRPDLLIILGDRFEMLAAATAALMLHVPVVHLCGGSITEGAVDDSIRHAITKMAALHLVETEPQRRRVIAMGEPPERVINTGSIGVWNVINQPLIGREELEADLGFDLGRPFAIVTYHPATLDTAEPAVRIKALLDALDRFPELALIITYPNNDARSAAIIEAIEAYAAANPERVKLVKSLGLRRYLSALRYARAVIGNSSSGLHEVPSAGIPTVDIGIRQHRRTAGPAVIHCGDSADEIAAAVAQALSPEMQELAAQRINPYFKPDTLQLMVDAIMALDPAEARVKHFYDITQQ